MMKSVIDADAAKLAGLQIDLLQKLRAGHITLEQLEWFTHLSGDNRDKLVAVNLPASKCVLPTDSRPILSTEKYGMFWDFGIITVPVDFRHATCLGKIREECGRKFNFFHGDITDEKCSHPTRTLKFGDKFHVRIFRQSINATGTMEERMQFLAAQRVVYTGVQGLALIIEHWYDQLPNGYRYNSLDREEALPHLGDYPMVPYLRVLPKGIYEFCFNHFHRVWRDDNCLVCFYECE